MGSTEPWIRPSLPLMVDDEVLEAQPDQAALTGRYLEQAVRFIRANAQQPFFFYLAHMCVHLPIYVQERLSRRRTTAIMAPPWSASIGWPRCCWPSSKRWGSTTRR